MIVENQFFYVTVQTKEQKEKVKDLMVGDKAQKVKLTAEQLMELFPKSYGRINFICDECGEPFSVICRERNFNERHLCRKCKTEATMLKNLGVKHALQSKTVQKKMKQTNLKNWGVEYASQSKIIKEKTEQTNLKNWGVKNVFQSEIIKEKLVETNLDRHGVEYPSQSNEIKEKIKQTNLEHWGVENVFQSEIIKNIIKETNLERYGVEHLSQLTEFKEKKKEICFFKYGTEYYTQTVECKEKIKQTNLEHWGVEYPLQLDIFKEKIRLTNLERYGVEYYSQTVECKEKIKQTNLDRYGYEHILQVPEIREKGLKTLYENETKVFASNQQIYLCVLFDGKLNYPVGYYPLDIAFPDEMLYIEYDGGGHDLNVKLGNITEKEFNQKEIRRGYYLRYRNWKQIRIKSKKDYLPLDNEIIDLINEAKNYLLNTEHSWVEIDIDKKEYKCSQYTKILNFNKLRKIK